MAQGTCIYALLGGNDIVSFLANFSSTLSFCTQTKRAFDPVPLL
jgi:hypothetical protein